THLQQSQLSPLDPFHFPGKAAHSAKLIELEHRSAAIDAQAASKVSPKSCDHEEAGQLNSRHSGAPSEEDFDELTSDIEVDDDEDDLSDQDLDLDGFSSGA